MEDFIKGAMLGMVVGAGIGAVCIAKNKKLANKIKDGLTTAEGKLKEAKENLQEKMESCDCSSSENSSSNDCNCSEQSFMGSETDKQKDFSKKNKNQ